MTYANEAKVKYCGVKPETLAAFGAVSEQTAFEMASGLRERSGADIAVATTGIAGPGGGTKEKPVGLVYVACADRHLSLIHISRQRTKAASRPEAGRRAIIRLDKSRFF